MNDLNCATALDECARLAVNAGRPVATVVYRWLTHECRY
jgi:hypothetical protein